MAAEAGSGALGAYGWVVVAVGVAAAGAGGLYYTGLIGSASETVTEASDQQVVAEPAAIKAEAKNVEPDVDEGVVSAEPATEVTKVEEESAALLAPSLDQIRIEPDGQALLAGRAVAGSALSVLLDGSEVASATIDASGQFAQFLTIPFSDGQRALTLRSEKDGVVVLSDDYFIAALPRQVAEQEIEQSEDTPVEQPIADAQTIQDDTVVVAKAEPVAKNEENPVTEQAPSISVDEKDEAVVEAQTMQPATETVVAEGSTDQTVAADLTVTETSETPDQGAETAAITAVEPSAVPQTEGGAAAVVASKPMSATLGPVELVDENPVPEVAEPSKDLVAENDAGTPSEPEIAPADVAVALNSEVVEPELAQTSPAILQSNAEGVRLVQAPNPEPEATLAQLVLDTIGYSDLGDVQLTGRAKIGSVIRIYLDNNSVSDLLADGEGHWRGELLGVDPGIYTLRLDELDTEGVVLSRLETPFKREAPEVLKPVVVESGPDPVPAPAIRAVTVQKGDTLWAISRERYGDGVLYVKVFEANRRSIRDPHLIYPGQIFRIPE